MTENQTTITSQENSSAPQKPAPQAPRQDRIGSKSAGIAFTAASCACVIASQLTDNAWTGWTLAGTGIVLLAVPHIVDAVRRRRHFGLMSIYRSIRNMGLNPEIDGDEISWTADGKTNVIRLHNGCQLQVCREYPAPQDHSGKFEAAAGSTMSEVFSAKVGISHDEDDNNVFFSTEMLCSSMKEFSRLLPASVAILDLAEDRQKENFLKLMNEEKTATPRRRIGYRMEKDVRNPEQHV